MRKIISLLIVFVLIFAFSACGKEEVFDIGKIKDGVYINDYMDIKATLPEGFEFMSDDEAKEAFGVTELYSEGSAFGYGAFGISATGASLSFTFENTEVSNTAKLSADEYIDNLAKQMEALGEDTLISCEKNALSDDIPCIDMEINASAGEDKITVFERVAVKEKDGWVCVITAGSTDKTDIETLFSGIEM